ncbi:MAG: aminopeptidase P family protein [Cryomorphaceae bacterium]|jgi:Xaa-Pro aminopeptidase|nr:aminopeptidase P family protein [Cryomorphaceae bacterium]
MKYKPLNNSIYKRNRLNFMNQMKGSSMAIFNSNDIYPVSADTELPFEQHRDIFYLTGIDQEETIVILYPSSKDNKTRENLFIRRSDEHTKIWEGEKLSKDLATKLSGVENVHFVEDFKNILHSISNKVDTFYINKNEHYRANSPVETREDRFINWLLKKYPAHKVAKSNPILQRLRSIKHLDEIDQIKKACQITKKGFDRVLRFVKPDVWEYQIEAEFIHEFINNSSKGFAYTPIIASGINNNVLHYIKNNKQCKDGDLILMDVGAEYGNYSSDMTRTIPVSGRFSKRQKEVYNSVLQVKNEATKLLTIGNNWKNFHEQVGEIMTQELFKIGLIDKNDIKNETKNNPAYKKYFMHGTSHHLGLDTHDYGLLEDPFQENMVFTVEPGIYIPKEGFGIRLEDDVVIKSKEEPLNLMSDIPIIADEIEDIMNS